MSQANFLHMNIFPERPNHKGQHESELVNLLHQKVHEAYWQPSRQFIREYIIEDLNFFFQKTKTPFLLFVDTKLKIVLYDSTDRMV